MTKLGDKTVELCGWAVRPFWLSTLTLGENPLCPRIVSILLNVARYIWANFDGNSTLLPTFSIKPTQRPPNNRFRNNLFFISTLWRSLLIFLLEASFILKSLSHSHWPFSVVYRFCIYTPTLPNRSTGTSSTNLIAFKAPIKDTSSANSEKKNA